MINYVPEGDGFAVYRDEFGESAVEEERSAFVITWTPGGKCHAVRVPYAKRFAKTACGVTIDRMSGKAYTDTTLVSCKKCLAVLGENRPTTERDIRAIVRKRLRMNTEATLYELTRAVIAEAGTGTDTIWRYIKPTITIARCHHCNRGRLAWFWPKGERRVQDTRCPRCRHWLAQTTLALDATFCRYEESTGKE
jgi:hypothetical protein